MLPVTNQLSGFSRGNGAKNVMAASSDHAIKQRVGLSLVVTGNFTERATENFALATTLGTLASKYSSSVGSTKD